MNRKLALPRNQTDLTAACIAAPTQYPGSSSRRTWSCPVSGRLTSEMTVAIRRQLGTNGVDYWSNGRPGQAPVMSTVPKYKCLPEIDRQVHVDRNHFKRSVNSGSEKSKWKIRNAKDNAGILTELPSNLTCLQFTNFLFSTPILPVSAAFEVPTPVRYMDILEERMKLKDEKDEKDEKTKGLLDFHNRKTSKTALNPTINLTVFPDNTNTTDNCDVTLPQQSYIGMDDPALLLGERAESLPVMTLKHQVKRIAHDLDRQEGRNFMKKVSPYSINNPDKHVQDTNQMKPDHIVVIETVKNHKKRPPILKNGRLRNTIVCPGTYGAMPGSLGKQPTGTLVERDYTDFNTGQTPQKPVSPSGFDPAPLQVSRCALSTAYPRYKDKFRKRSVRFKVCNEVIEFTPTEPVCF